MNRLRKLTLVCGTVGIAVGAGHLVEQRGAAVPTLVEPVSAGPAETAASPVRMATFMTPDLPQAPGAAPAPVVQAALSDPAGTPVAPVMNIVLPPPAAPDTVAAAPAPAVPDCTAALQLIPLPGGELSVWLKAPCAAGARVELRQEGLALAYRTLPSGNLFVTLPALSDRPMVAARLPDGDTVIATTSVPDLAGLRRLGVAWGAGDAFQLISDDGEKPVMLGDPEADKAMVAAMLTLPSGAAAPAFEAAVTPATCGRVMTGSVVVQDGASVRVSDLTLAMPACDAVGDILVLNNLLPDVTLAAR